MSDVTFTDSPSTPGLLRGFYSSPAYACGPRGQNCQHELIRRCLGTAPYGLIFAKTTFEHRLRKQPVQREEFWRALENFFDTELPRINERRAEMAKVSRCEHCHGTGLIRRSE